MMPPKPAIGEIWQDGEKLFLIVHHIDDDEHYQHYAGMNIEEGGLFHLYILNKGLNRLRKFSSLVDTLGI